MDKRNRSHIVILLFSAMLFTTVTMFSHSAKCEPAEKPAAQENTDLTPAEKALMIEQATAALNVEIVDPEVEKFVAECKAAPQKSLFVFQNSQYINKRFQDMALYVWDCNAFASGQEASCNLVDDPAAKKIEFKDDIEKKCKSKFGYYFHLSKAAQSPATCKEEATKFCVNSGFCPKCCEKCTCDRLAMYICAFPKVDSPDDCDKLPGEFSAYATLSAQERKGAVETCKVVLKGDYAAAPKGNDTRYSNMIFLFGVFQGKKWPLLSKEVDLEEMNIDPEFIWYYDNIQNKKKSCSEQLDNSWEMLCKEYAITKSINGKKNNTGESAPDTDSSK